MLELTCWATRPCGRFVSDQESQWRRMLCDEALGWWPDARSCCRWLVPIWPIQGAVGFQQDIRKWDLGPPSWKGMGKGLRQLPKNRGWDHRRGSSLPYRSTSTSLPTQGLSPEAWRSLAAPGERRRTGFHNDHSSPKLKPVQTKSNWYATTWFGWCSCILASCCCCYWSHYHKAFKGSKGRWLPWRASSARREAALDQESLGL